MILAVIILKLFAIAEKVKLEVHILDTHMMINHRWDPSHEEIEASKEKIFGTRKK